MPVSRRTPEERSEEGVNFLTWRSNKKGDSFDPTWEFKKIDQLLPKKKGEKRKDRAKDIESALDWCRNKEVKP